MTRRELIMSAGGLLLVSGANTEIGTLVTGPIKTAANTFGWAANTLATFRRRSDRQTVAVAGSSLASPEAKIAAAVPDPYCADWTVKFLRNRDVFEPLLKPKEGPHDRLWALTVNHPVLAAVAKKTTEGFLNEKLKSNPQVPLAGDFLRGIYSEIKNQVVFPKTYSERDRTHYLLDLTLTAAASAVDQFTSTYDAITSLNIDVPWGSYIDNARPMIYHYFDLLTRLFPATQNHSFDRFTRSFLANGSDRSQHAFFHARLTWDNLAFFETGNPDLIAVQYFPGQKFFDKLWAVVPVSPEEKALRVSQGVGKGWEIYETGRAFWRNFRDRSLAELANPAVATNVAAKIINESLTTGYGDATEPLDELANHLGALLAVFLYNAQSEAEVDYAFSALNAPDINTLQRQVAGPRLLAIENFLYNATKEPAHNEPPHYSNDAIFRRLLTR